MQRQEVIIAPLVVVVLFGVIFITSATGVSAFVFVTDEIDAVDAHVVTDGLSSGSTRGISLSPILLPQSRTALVPASPQKKIPRQSPYLHGVKNKVCNMSVQSAAGEWTDGKSHLMIVMGSHSLNSRSRSSNSSNNVGPFTVTGGPWPGAPPHGDILVNGSLTLVFSGFKPAITSTGILFASSNDTANGGWGSSCDFIEWTDPADRRAHNTWCRVGAAACRSPPSPSPSPSPPSPSPSPSPPPPSPRPGFAPLHGGSFSGPMVPASPDPLVAYRWDAASIAANKLQIFTRRPLRLLGSVTSEAFAGADSLLMNGSDTGMEVTGFGSVAFDFGSECAGWLEFSAEGLDKILIAGAVSVLASTSEHTMPQVTTPTSENNKGNCTAHVTPLGGDRYRLVLNSQLYEGLRYGWLHVRDGGKGEGEGEGGGVVVGGSGGGSNAAISGKTKARPMISKWPEGQSFRVYNLTAVCQIMPVNYVDYAFTAGGVSSSSKVSSAASIAPITITTSDATTDKGSSSSGTSSKISTTTTTTTTTTPTPTTTTTTTLGAGPFALEQVWYTAMYTTRVDLLEGGFGSILMDRGDRISWTGDAHLAQKAFLTGFGNDHGAALVRANTDRTKVQDNGIISYDMYFVLSAVDYYVHTGDYAALEGWAPLIETKFKTCVAFWAAPKTQAFCGSDDRLGADFEHWPPSEAEKTRYYKMLTIQAAREYASAVVGCGSACSPGMRQRAAALGAEFTANFEKERAMLNTTYGMHAVAGAILTGLTTPKEESTAYTYLLSNPAHLCSFSPFNTFFVLQAVGRLRGLVGGRRAAMRMALLMVRRCFYGQIAMGATTFWETFSPEWIGKIASGAPTPNSQTGYMSHCHPWASGAAPWLSRNVLGLKPLAPAWSNFSFTPFLDVAAPNLLGSVAGTQALTGNRSIHAGFSCNGSGYLTVPESTLATNVALPLCGAPPKGHHAVVNGQSVAAVIGDDALVLTSPLGPGSYTLGITPTTATTTRSSFWSSNRKSAAASASGAGNGKASGAGFDGSLSSYKNTEGGRKFVEEKREEGEEAEREEEGEEEEAEGGGGGRGEGEEGRRLRGEYEEDPLPTYRDRFVRADVNAGGGTWRSAGYGKQGRVMWSWNAAGSDNEHLPSAVQSVSVNCPYTGVSGKKTTPNWVSPTSQPCAAHDSRALEAPLNYSSNCSGLGAYSCGTVATIDVAPSPEQAGLLSGGGPLNLTLYLVDWERRGRRCAIELREYSNLQLAAPTQIVSNFTEGIFMTWEVEKLPVRFRLMQIAGDLPYNNELLAFSALFFDY